MQKITPFLWFDKEAGEAAKFYTQAFKDAKMIDTTTFEDTPSGTVEIVTIWLLGQEFQLKKFDIAALQRAWDAD